MKIEVVFAKPHAALIAVMRLNAGAIVSDAIKELKNLNGFDSLIISENSYGIFGQEVGLDERLKEGDRLEIYRPLQCDPKELRRKRQRRKSS